MLDREKRENKATKRRGSIYGENTVTNNKSSRVDREENAYASKSFDKVIIVRKSSLRLRRVTNQLPVQSFFRSRYPVSR